MSQNVTQSSQWAKAPESQYPSKQGVFHCCSCSWSCGGQRWTLCVSHKCSLKATAHRLAEELVSQDPAVLWLGWRSAPALSQRVQTCVSCCKEQAAKAAEQESCSLAALNLCLGAESVTSLLNLHWSLTVSSEWGIKSVCLVSYVPVWSSWLKAIIFNFCSPFPEHCYFCGFLLFGTLIILSFFYSQLSVYKQIQNLCPPLLPTPMLQVHCSEIWIEIFPGLCHLGLSCHGKNHIIHAVPEIQWSDSCFLSPTHLSVVLFLCFSQTPAFLMFRNIQTFNLDLYVGSVCFLLLQHSFSFALLRLEVSRAFSLISV